MYTAYGNFAILLTLMQLATDYLLTLQDFDFWRFFGHKRPIQSKSKDVPYTILTLPETKRFLILSCLSFCFRKLILVLNFFSLIMLGMVTLWLLKLGWP